VSEAIWAERDGLEARRSKPDSKQYSAETFDLSRWLSDHALPLWLEAGHCPKTRIAEEALTFDGGSAALTITRLRVQARQIYVFARAAHRGMGHAYGERAEQLFEGLLEHGWADHGGFVHTLARTGGAQETMRDLYDHAFVLFALGWYYRASGEPAALKWAEKTQAFIDSAMRGHQRPGYMETPEGLLPRRQNPHMHLFEAYLALYEATQDQQWLDRATELFGLFTCHIWDRRTGLINEYFDAEWGIVTPQGRPPFEPGHHFEWVWLLSEYQRLKGEDISFVIRRAFNTAMRIGRDSEGFATDYMDRDGPVGTSRRLWPQAELIRALKLFRPSDAEIMQDKLGRTYLATPQKGLWFDRFEDGANVAPNVPASTLYHLAGLVWDCQDGIASR